MTHPLTDDHCDSLRRKCHRIWGSELRYETMRLAFDKGADWQLERDAEIFAAYLVKHLGFAPKIAQLRAEDFKKAMRPQEDNP